MVVCPQQIGFGLICGTILSFRFGVPIGALVFGALWGLFQCCHIPGKPGGMGAGDVKLSGMIGVFGVEAYCFSTFSELLVGQLSEWDCYYWEKGRKMPSLCSFSCFWGCGSLTLGNRYY